MGKIPDKLMLIVNPSSGGGRSLDLLPDIDRMITGLGVKPDIRISQSAEDATQMSKFAVKCGYERVLALGGDGTVNMVASGIAGKDTVLGVIPAGTGNDFFAMLEIDNDLENVVKVAVKGDPITTDVGTIDNKLFFNMVGIGFDALIAKTVSNEPQKFGAVSYLVGVYKNLKDYPSNPIKLRVDSYELDQDALLVAVGIGRRTGKGFQLTPSAKPDDGKFDVCVVKDAKPFRILRLLPKALRGKHVRAPEVEIYRCRQLEIFTEKPLPIHYEGEPSMSTNGKISIKMSRSKLQVAAGVKVNR